ncbi:MAG: polysaccharide export outer membrane protein, partial [Gammaproteobacteria bacterium]
MKTVLFNLTKRVKINAVTSVFSFFLLAGCAQQHSLQEIENSSSSFYGAINDRGELFSQQSVPGKVFAAQLNCDDRADFAA